MVFGNLETTSSAAEKIKKLTAKALADADFRAKLLGTDWLSAKNAIMAAKLGFTDADAEAIAKKTTSLTVEQKNQFYDAALKAATDTALPLMTNSTTGLW